MTMMYNMRHIDLTVPEVLNNGRPSHYVDTIREELQELGHTGWTEHRAIGWWRSEEERVTVFTLYIPFEGWRVAVARIGEMARHVMSDQEAIQLVDHGELAVIEF